MKKQLTTTQCRHIVRLPVLALLCLLSGCASEFTYSFQDEGLFHFDCGRRTQLTTPPAGATDRKAAWSKDGEQLAFIRSVRGASGTSTSSIYLLRIGEPAVMLDGTTGAKEFIWSNDGDFLLFVDGDRPFGGSTLNRINLETGETLQLTADGLRVANPQLSLDDSEVLYLQDFPINDPAGESFPSEYRFVYRMGIDTSNRRQIFENTLGIRGIAWSPVSDHRDIAMIAIGPHLTIPDRNQSQVWFVSEDGTDLLRAAAGSPFTFLKWSPDGQQVLYGCDGDERLCLVTRITPTASARVVPTAGMTRPWPGTAGDWFQGPRMILLGTRDASVDNTFSIFSIHFKDDGRSGVKRVTTGSQPIYRPDSSGICARSRSIFFGS